ncbi:serine/threonine-protein kinase TIO-like [Rutidosis leptorrhynchoides]|uniref:serine/threonine-protein kinase TIO-like n=1 Tax=Rutidosis leptorrhynchoides TaxID=125765 RepID=UPI003A9A219A
MSSVTLQLLDFTGVVGENAYERKSEATLFQENWIPISLPESWDDGVSMSNQSEVSVVTNLVATGARDSKGVADEIFWEHMSITVNIVRMKKSDYNRGQLHLLDDLLIKCFSLLRKLLDNNGGGFGDSYISHWVAVVELYKEVAGCTEDASGRLVYESVACIRIILSGVVQHLKASKATKHTEVATNTLREMLDHAKAFGVIDDLLSCVATCGKSLMSGSSNLLRAACEACETIWSLIHAFEIQSRKENEPVFPLSSMYSNSLDQINIKDEYVPLMGTDYEEIVETVTQEFLRSDDIRVAIFYCLCQRLEASWSSVIQIILRCCLHNDLVARVLCGLSSSCSSVVGGGGDNTIISEVFSLISLCASFDKDSHQQDTKNLKIKVSDPSDLVLHACLLLATVAQSIDVETGENTAVSMLTSSRETQKSRLCDLAHHYSLCDGIQNFRPHSMSAMLALAYMCSLENGEAVATSIREIVVPLIPPSATLCAYLRMSTTDAQGGKVMLSYWHGIRDGCAVLLFFRLFWGGPLAIQDLGGSDIHQTLIDMLGNNQQQHSDEIGLSPLGISWIVSSLRMCLKGGSSVFRQVLLTSENVKIMGNLISDVHLKLLRYWVGPGGGKSGVKDTVDQVVFLLRIPFDASEGRHELGDMDSQSRKDMFIEIKESMDKYIQILLEVGLPGQIIKCLEHLELKDTKQTLGLLFIMVDHRSLVVELVRKGLLNPILMKSLLDDSSPTQVKLRVLQIVTGIAKMDQEFYKPIEGADILQQLKAFLTHEDPNVRAWTLSAIGEMCKHSSYFYSLLAKHNISSLLVDLLFDKDDYPQRMSTFAIARISLFSEFFHEDLRRCIHQLAKLLLSAETPIVTKRNAAICLNNLSYFSGKLSEDMISKGAMEALLKVVADCSIVALDPNRIDDVKNSPLDSTLEALATMCKNQPCRQFILSSDVYPTIGQLRESPDEDIASYSTLIFNIVSFFLDDFISTTEFTPNRSSRYFNSQLIVHQGYMGCVHNVRDIKITGNTTGTKQNTGRVRSLLYSYFLRTVIFVSIAYAIGIMDNVAEVPKEPQRMSTETFQSFGTKLNGIVKRAAL